MADKDTVKEALEAFGEFSDQEAEQRGLMIEDYEFRALKQWPDDIRHKREADVNGPRPCLTLDRTNQHIRQVVNDARQNRPGIRVRPVDSSADIKTAEMLQDLVRNIEDVSKADLAYDWSIECACTGGLGWIRLISKELGVSGEQEPRIMRVPNPLSVYVGTGWTEPDGCDLTSAIVTERMRRKEFVRKYPDADPCSFSEAEGDMLEWVGKDDLQIAEFFRIDEEKTNVLILRGLGEMDEQAYWDAYSGLDGRPEVEGNRERRKRVVRWWKVTARDVLETTTFPGYYIPLIPVIGREIWVGNKRILMGMVRPAIDPQRMYNYSRSAYAEMVSLSPRAKWLMAEGQIDGYERDWEQSNISTNPVLQYRTTSLNGQPIGPPQRIYGPEVPQGIVQDLMLSERDLQSAMGQYGPSLGAPSNERSGIAIREKKQEGDVGSFDFHDNQSRSIRQLGRMLCGSDEGPGVIQALYDTKRIARVLGENGDPKYAEINPDQEIAYGRFRQADGSYREVFNPTVGRYDTTVSAGPSYTTKRAEAAAAMVEVVRAAPQVLQTHGDLIFKAQDWPMAEEFAKRFRSLLPPQVLQAEQQDEEGKPVDPRMQAAIQQMQQVIKAQQQALAQAQQAMQQAEMKAQTAEQKAGVDVLKAQNDKMKAEIEASKAMVAAFEAETERMKVAGETQASGAEAAAEVMEAQAAINALNQAAVVMSGIGEQVTNGNAAIVQVLAGVQAALMAIAQKPPEVPERKQITIKAPSGAVYHGEVN